MREYWSSQEARQQEEEIMNILMGSSLFEEMTVEERNKLLSYLVSSYFRPRMGENCRAHLRLVQSVPEMR